MLLGRPCLSDQKPRTKPTRELTRIASPSNTADRAIKMLSPERIFARQAEGNGMAEAAGKTAGRAGTSPHP